MYKWIEYWNKIYKRRSCTVRSAVTLKRLYSTFSHCAWIVTTQRNKITFYVMYHKELLQLNIVGILCSPSVNMFSEKLRHVAFTYFKTICIACNNFLFVFFLAVLECLVPCKKRSRSISSETVSNRCKKKTKKFSNEVIVAVLYIFLTTPCLCVRLQILKDLTDHCMILMSWIIQVETWFFFFFCL